MSSSGSSARWVCSRTSRRSASSAVADMSRRLTVNGEHGARAIRTMAPRERSWWADDGRLAGGQDGVFVLAHRVRRQAAVLFGDAHRTPGRVEAEADLARGGDLGRQQVAGAGGVDVQVVGRRRAAAQRQLGQADEGRKVDGFLVEQGPVRVQDAQPIEQARADGGRKSAGEVLEDVVVGVDQARRDQAAGRL